MFLPRHNQDTIHVKFILEDGSFRHVDCDLNIPTIHVCTEYDGNKEEVGRFIPSTNTSSRLDRGGMGVPGGSQLTTPR